MPFPKVAILTQIYLYYAITCLKQAFCHFLGCLLRTGLTAVREPVLYIVEAKLNSHSPVEGKLNSLTSA